MNTRIYLDNNATTAIDPRVFDAVVYHLKQTPGNPSSLHSYGQEARNLLNKSRRRIADALHVKPSEIVFTSNGTEGMNMLLRGILEDPSAHIITSSIEHSCVFFTLKHMQSKGCNVTFLEPGLWGAITPQAIQAAIRSDTRFISIMAVNNETGVKTDIESIAHIAKQARIPLIVDGVGLLGKELFKIPEGVSAMAFSGHKFHAPKGIGFVYIRSSLKIHPLLIGGEQEFGKRAGTENLPEIVGLAEAVSLIEQELPKASERMAFLRDQLENTLKERLGGVTVNGQGPRICNTANLSFEGVEGETLLTMLDLEGVAVSHGSACASGALEPSRILLNMGIPSASASTAIRFSLSRFTTPEEITMAIDRIVQVVKKLRS